MNIKVHKLINFSVAEMISSITQNRGLDFVPLSYYPRTYIDPEALMLKHDKRVQREFEEWKRKNLH